MKFDGLDRNIVCFFYSYSFRLTLRIFINNDDFSKISTIDIIELAGYNKIFLLRFSISSRFLSLALFKE